MNIQIPPVVRVKIKFHFKVCLLVVFTKCRLRNGFIYTHIDLLSNPIGGQDI